MLQLLMSPPNGERQRWPLGGSAVRFADATRPLLLRRLDDRMDSYFLAETTKYLFLLFDHALVPSGHAQLYAHATPPTCRHTRKPI